jgi:hypothetical protein
MITTFFEGAEEQAASIAMARRPVKIFFMICFK